MSLLSSELYSSVDTRAVNSVLSIDEETQEADANELPRSPGHYAALTVRGQGAHKEQHGPGSDLQTPGSSLLSLYSLTDQLDQLPCCV